MKTKQKNKGKGKRRSSTALDGMVVLDSIIWLKKLYKTYFT